MKEITVLGIGNILWQDEGFGVQVLTMLNKQYHFASNIQLLDGGTMGMELLAFLQGCKKLIIIDAIDGGKAPGSFYRISGPDVDTYFQEKLSVHELGIKDVLSTLSLIGEPLEAVTVVGIQPVSLEMGIELTPLAKSRCQLVINSVLAELQSWQANVVKVC